MGGGGKALVELLASLRLRFDDGFTAPSLGFVAVVLLAVTGCGGEEETEFSPIVSEPLAKVEFLREADRICYSTEARIEAAADELVSRPGGPDPAQVERVALAVAVPALETEVRAIRSLGAPEGDEDEVAAILEATERGIAEIEAHPRRLVDGPPPSLRRAERLARAYGSRECGF